MKKMIIKTGLGLVAMTMLFSGCGNDNTVSDIKSDTSGINNNAVILYLPYKLGYEGAKIGSENYYSHKGYCEGIASGYEAFYKDTTPMFQACITGALEKNNNQQMLTEELFVAKFNK